MLLEQLDHPYSRFLTLTYAQDPGVLDYAHFQGFMKRYREKYGPCRFLAVGEYGEQGGRGHWHAIIYGHKQEWQSYAPIKEWTDYHGYAFDGEGNHITMAYVAGYVLKKEVDLERSLLRMSLKPGIGFRAIGAFARNMALAGQKGAVFHNWPGRIRVGGRTYPLHDGALTYFKRIYLKEGGSIPINDIPHERHYLNLYYTQGDAYFEERSTRDRWSAYEKGLLGGLKQKSRQII